ncbi:MAG: hypothetical protein A49_27290 [Methyloceanibacter sp.]|nr:MAG: hypothetical protein A49_27290 [Methyloceanibacter sp.]
MAVRIVSSRSTAPAKRRRGEAQGLLIGAGALACRIGDLRRLAKRLIDIRDQVLAFEPHAIDPPPDELGAGCGNDGLGDQDFRSISDVQRFQPAGRIDGVAERRVAQSFRRAHIADDRRARAETEMRGQSRLAARLPFGVSLAKQAPAGQHRGNGVGRMILERVRRAPKRDHPIADDLVDRSAFALQRRDHELEVVRHVLGELLGRHGFGDAGEIPDVGEEHREARFLAPDHRDLAPPDQFPDQGHGHVARERPDAREHLRLRFGELSDFADAGPHLRGLAQVQIADLDALFGESLERPAVVAGREPGEQ